MPLRRALAGMLLVLTACARPQAVPVSARGAVPRALARDVAPFPVLDAAGRAYDVPFLGGWNTPRPQLLDADGDGDLDLLVQEYSNRLTLLANEGPGADGLPRWRFVSDRWAGLEPGEWSRFLDVDGDGALDAFAELPFSYMRLWRRTGATFAAGDTIRDADRVAIFADRQNIPQIVDLDCDGRLDLLIGRIAGTILHYEADAPGPAPVFRLVTDRFQDLEIVTGQGSMHGANTMAFADHDRDGDLDLFWGDFFEAGLLLFENTGTCAEPSLRRDGVRFPIEDPVVTSGYNAPAFGDVNGDGAQDLVVGVIGGAYDPNRSAVQNLWFYDRASVRRTGQLVGQVDVGAESKPLLADLDGDGDLDLIVGNKIEPDDRATARLYLLENTGSRTKPVLRLRGPLPLGGRFQLAPSAGDLDGDGDLDLVLGGFGATVALAVNEGGTFRLADSAFVTIPRGSNATPALGDLDGDGDLDLLVGEGSGALNFYRNDGTRAAPRFTLVSESFEDLRVGRRSGPLLHDLDRDGDLDLLLGTDESGLVLYVNEGTRTAWRFVRDSAFAPDVPPLSSPAAGDLDGDGRVELLVGNAGGGLVHFRAR